MVGDFITAVQCCGIGSGPGEIYYCTASLKKYASPNTKISIWSGPTTTLVVKAGNYCLTCADSAIPSVPRDTGTGEIVPNSTHTGSIRGTVVSSSLTHICNMKYKNEIREFQICGINIYPWELQ